jgi:hypothetical protein
MMSNAAKDSVANLFAQIEKSCAASGTIGMEVGCDDVNCTMTNSSVSLILEWDVVNGVLSVSELSYRAVIPGERIPGFAFYPEALSKTYFRPDRLSGDDLGWRENGKPQNSLLSVRELADQFMSQFMALDQLDKSGRIKRKSLSASRLSPRAGRPMYR